jgi:DNA polymerase-3 subunit alpha|tara:strand:- start:2310 stop:3089 length:780 start_codon:yes stop_codon:yes gene_type:complete
MTNNILPLFKSHYSLGRSILTLDKPAERDGKHPDSIFEILEDEGMDEFYLVDDNISGYLQANINAEELNKKLIFGIRITILNDANDKTDTSKKTESKAVIFARNKEGYQNLIKIWSKAAQGGFYYVPRIDRSAFEGLNMENNLLSIPFYDSYIYNNNFTCGLCVPDFLSDFKHKVFMYEDNDMPFDTNLKDLVKSESEERSCQLIKAKSIYYKNNKDFISYLTFKALQNRGTLEKPNLDHMCSNYFSFEQWKIQEANYV